MRVSAACASASASRNSRPRILLPPNPIPVMSSRLTHSFGPPIDADSLEASTSGVGKYARGTRGIALNPGTCVRSECIGLPQFCQYPVYHCPAVTRVLLVIEKRSDLFFRQVGGNLRILQKSFLESTPLRVCGHCSLIHEGMSALFTNPCRQCQHHGFGEHEPPRYFQVRKH